MHVRLGLAGTLAVTLAAAMVAPSAGAVSSGVARPGAAPAPPPTSAPASASYRIAHEPSKVTQKYKCTTPVGNVTEPIDVSGKVKKSGGVLNLSGVTFTFLNNFGVGVTINKIKFAVPDPNPDSAPYQSGSAAVTRTPPGWKAGHTSTDGIYEYFAGTQDLADGATIPVPKLSATYKDAGPKGTLVEWKPGVFSFNVKSPDPGAIVCTPKAPIQTFASYQE